MKARANIKEVLRTNRKKLLMNIFSQNGSSNQNDFQVRNDVKKRSTEIHTLNLSTHVRNFNFSKIGIKYR